MSTAKKPATDGSADVKARIRGVASVQFALHGYDATGIRDIAKAAGVNPAIVIRHFESKDRLFVECMPVYDSWTAIFEHGPIEDLGYRIVRHIAASRRGQNNGMTVHVALVQALGRPPVREHMRESFVHSLVQRITRWMDAPDALLRAHVAAAQVFGLTTQMFVLKDEVLMSMSDEDLINRYGGAIQASLTGPVIPDPSSKPARARPRTANGKATAAKPKTPTPKTPAPKTPKPTTAKRAATKR